MAYNNQNMCNGIKALKTKNKLNGKQQKTIWMAHDKNRFRWHTENKKNKTNTLCSMFLSFWVQKKTFKKKITDRRKKCKTNRLILTNNKPMTIGKLWTEYREFPKHYYFVVVGQESAHKGTGIGVRFFMGNFRCYWKYFQVSDLEVWIIDC